MVPHECKQIDPTANEDQESEAEPRLEPWYDGNPFKVKPYTKEFVAQYFRPNDLDGIIQNENPLYVPREIEYRQPIERLTASELNLVTGLFPYVPDNCFLKVDCHHLSNNKNRTNSCITVPIIAKTNTVNTENKQGIIPFLNRSMTQANMIAGCTGAPSMNDGPCCHTGATCGREECTNNRLRPVAFLSKLNIAKKSASHRDQIFASQFTCNSRRFQYLNYFLQEKVRFQTTEAGQIHNTQDARIRFGILVPAGGTARQIARENHATNLETQEGAGDEGAENEELFLRSFDADDIARQTDKIVENEFETLKHSKKFKEETKYDVESGVFDNTPVPAPHLPTQSYLFSVRQREREREREDKETDKRETSYHVLYC